METTIDHHWHEENMKHVYSFGSSNLAFFSGPGETVSSASSSNFLFPVDPAGEGAGAVPFPFALGKLVPVADESATGGAAVFFFFLTIPLRSFTGAEGSNAGPDPEPDPEAEADEMALNASSFVSCSAARAGADFSRPAGADLRSSIWIARRVVLVYKYRSEDTRVKK